MFRAHVFIVRRAKLYYTVSGIITLCRWPSGAQIVYGTATYRCDDTRHCIIQFCLPDDEHICSKHVEAWNKLIKFSASSWLILRNKYIEMHGQQNIKIWYKCIYFNTCTAHSLLFFIITNKYTINTTKLYITRVFPCKISTPTCFDILCHHQTVTYLLLAKLHKFLDCSCWIS